MDHVLADPVTDPVRTTGPTVPPGPTLLPVVNPVLPVPMAIQADEDAHATFVSETSVRSLGVIGPVRTAPPISVSVPATQGPAGGPETATPAAPADPMATQVVAEGQTT